jgi:hypothetical protein
MAGTAGAARDGSIDILRGFALVSIFINHIPHNVLEPYTHKNYGLSDSAELFVLLAGIAAAFAYFRAFEAGDRLLASARAVKRAGTLYVAHLASTAVGIGIFSAGVILWNRPDLLDQINLAPIRDMPVETAVGIPLLGHQLGYHNILPMYVCLLLIVPVMMLLAARSLHLMLGASIAVYAATQVFGWNLPNYPTPGGWFFNPFAWQLIFSIGFFAGARIRRGETPVPFNPWVYAAAVLYLVGAGVWHRWNLYGSLPEIPFLPHNFQINEKPWVAAPRLAHILSLAYVVGHSPLIRWLRKAGPRNPVSLLGLLGRHALPVFWTGTALSMAGQVLMLTGPLDPSAQIAYIAAGLAVQLALAWGLDWMAAADKGRRAARPAAAASGTAATAPSAGAASAGF